MSFSTSFIHEEIKQFRIATVLKYLRKDGLYLCVQCSLINCILFLSLFYNFLI